MTSPINVADRHVRPERRGRERIAVRARRALQHAIDGVQQRFDLFPQLLYQPMPWLGRVASRRATGTFERWRAIEAELGTVDVGSALDVGCQAGYFSISLAEQSIPTLGVDSDARSLRIAQHATRKADVDNIGWCRLEVNPHTVDLLPRVDAVLALSVWHHWVSAYGFNSAGSMLSSLWDRCAKVLFFETGEAEMPPEFGLPDMQGGAEEWIASYLGERCPGSAISVLGRHKAFGPGGDETRNVAYRTLFAIRRTPNVIAPLG